MERRFSRPGFGERRFDRGFDRDFEKPVKEGETYDVEIKEVGSKGDGIARVKNFVIFVPGVKEGDKCKIKITQVSRKFAIAEKVEGEVSEEPKEEVSEEPEVAEEKKPEKKASKEVKESKGEKVEDK